MAPPIEFNEQARLQALYDLERVGSPIEPQYQAICRASQALFDVPVAIVSLVAEDEQWFKGNCGLDLGGTSREISFCTHTIMSADVMVVEDALKDARFADSPLVVGPPYIRFYAGAPLILSQGINLGSLCLIDHVPRTITSEQKNQLQHFAAIVVSSLRQNRSRDADDATLRDMVDEAPDVIAHTELNGGTYTYVSQAARRLFGYDPGELIGRAGLDLVHPDDRGEMEDALDEFRAGSTAVIMLEQRWKRKDGVYARVATTLRTGAREGGHGRGIVSVMRMP